MLSSPRSRIALAPLVNADESDPLWTETPTCILVCRRPPLVQHDEDATRVFASDELRARAARVEQIREAFAPQPSEDLTKTAPLSSCFRQLRHEPRATLPRQTVRAPAPPCPPSGTRMREPAPFAVPVRAPLLLTPSEPITAVQREAEKTTARRSSLLVATVFVLVAVATFFVARLDFVAPSSLPAARDLVESVLAIGHQ